MNGEGAVRLGARFLNESCKFSCSQNPSISIQTVVPGCVTAGERGIGKLLTTSAQCRVAIPLPCPILTSMAGGVPTVCQFAAAGGWMNPSPKVRCEGKALLTKNSFLMCVYGGRVAPSLFPPPRGVMANGGFVHIQDLQQSPAQSGGKADQPDRASASEGVSPEHTGTGAPDRSAPESTRAEALAGAAAVSSEAPAYAEYAACPYQNCEKRGECGYFMGRIDRDVVNNRASLLRKNREGLDLAFKALHEKHLAKCAAVGIGWTLAAHHIIPGNQVLLARDGNDWGLRCGWLLKLMGYYEYDVNQAANGIFLPTYPAVPAEGAQQPKFSEYAQSRKDDIAGEAMRRLKRQWHTGGHSYRLDKTSLRLLRQRYQDFYRSHRELGAFPADADFNYCNTVQARLDPVMGRYVTEQQKKKCRAEDYERKRQKFIADMNGVSQKIGDRLTAFGDDPRLSFPFYVSKTALEYAFGLNPSQKVIVLSRAPGGVFCEKLQATLENGGIRLRELGGIPADDARKLIRFCENAMYFLVDVPSDYRLPFRADAEPAPVVQRISLDGADVKTYLYLHQRELMELFRANPVPWQPVVGTILKRGG